MHATSNPPRRFHPPRGISNNEYLADTWLCPVCNSHVDNYHRPGRPRIYCTNACRQRSYRWRRDNHARLHATIHNPPERATYAYGKHHALRSPRDPSSRLHDPISRELTICGVLARPSRYGTFVHDDLVLWSDTSCRTCVQLVTPPGTQPPPIYIPESLERPHLLAGKPSTQHLIPYQPVRTRTAA